MSKVEFSAGGIVYRKKGGQVEIALILDPYKKWTFPKGRIEKNESPERAAVREVGEEIGISNLRPIRLVDKIDYWFRREGELYHKFVYFFLLEAPIEGKLKHQKEEILDVRWFKPEKSLEAVGYRKDDVPLLQKSLQFLERLAQKD